MTRKYGEVIRLNGRFLAALSALLLLAGLVAPLPAAFAADNPSPPPAALSQGGEEDQSLSTGGEGADDPGPDDPGPDDPGPDGPGPATPPEENVVSDFAALKAWLAAHEEGGMVHLGADIRLSGGDALELADVTVDTGAFGLVLENDGLLRIGEGTVITGDGTARPVIEVGESGRLYILYAPASTAPRLAAAAEGGCALSIGQGANYDQGPGSIFYIHSNGGTALRSQVPLDLEGHVIDAGGGSGIVADKPVALFLCAVSGGAASVQAPSGVADTCVLSPAPSGAVRTIHRTIAALTIMDPVMDAGKELPEFIGMPASAGEEKRDGRPLRTSGTLRAEGEKDRSIFLSPTLVVPAGTDTSKPGDIPLTVQLEERYEPFGLIPEGVNLCTLVVRDLRVPYFMVGASYMGLCYAEYCYRVAEGLGPLTVWRSSDEGKSWYDATAQTQMNLTATTLELEFTGEKDETIYIVVAADGVGETEILRFVWGTELPDIGGDRAGGGRDEHTLPPGSGPSVPPDTYDSDPGPDLSGPAPSLHAPGAGQLSGADPLPLADNAGAEAPAAPGDADPGGFVLAATPELPVGESIYRAGDVGAQPVRTNPAPPARTPGATPPAAPAEWETEDGRGLTMTAARLAELTRAAEGLYVEFDRGALRLSLPVSVLGNLSLAEGDTLTVTLWQPDEASFAVSFASEVSLPERFSECFLVSFPWIGTPPAVVDEGGETIPARSDSGGRASAALTRGGLYRLAAAAVTDGGVSTSASIQMAPVPRAAAGSAAPYRDSWTPTVLAFSCSFAAAGIFLYLTRKRWRRQP